jgi:hypothetical protein
VSPVRTNRQFPEQNQHRTLASPRAFVSHFRISRQCLYPLDVRSSGTFPRQAPLVFWNWPPPGFALWLLTRRGKRIGVGEGPCVRWGLVPEILPFRAHWQVSILIDELPKGCAETAGANWQQGYRQPAFTFTFSIFPSRNFAGRCTALTRCASRALQARSITDA